jgi:hypothetical protein
VHPSSLRSRSLLSFRRLYNLISFLFTSYILPPVSLSRLVDSSSLTFDFYVLINCPHQLSSYLLLVSLPMVRINSAGILARCCCPESVSKFVSFIIVTHFLEETLSALDGKVAAIFIDWVVTSPNQDFVPEFKLGHTQVYLRADGRYGQDDATLWPQPYHDKYPHLTAIPRKPTDAHTNLNVMWWTPSRSSWRQSKQATIVGVGQLVGPEVDKLRKLKDELKVDALKFLEAPRDTPVLVHSCYTAMIHSWGRFDGYPGTFHEKLLEVVEFQRNWLELRGAVDYFEKVIYKIWKEIEPEGQVLERVGCFTTSAVVAQECFAAGLPVWFVRDADKLGNGSVRIDKIVVPHMAEDRLDLTRWHANDFPVLYDGNPNHANRYIVQHQFTRSRMCWKDPWGNEVDGDSENPLEMGYKDVSSTARSLNEMESFQPIKATSKLLSQIVGIFYSC